MIFRTILIATFVSLTPASAEATILLNLVDAPDQVDTPYSFDILATSSNLTISFAGYNAPLVQLVNYIGLSKAGGSNLLGRTWTFTPAPTGSWALQANDSTSVNALLFYGTDVGSYDTFSQTISAVAGSAYRLSFMFYEDGSPNGLRVTTDGDLAASPAPEPSTWMSMIGGFAMVGGAMRRQRTRVRFA
jgi:hypothetical protein